MKKELWLVIGVVAIVLAVVVNTGDIGLGPRGSPGDVNGDLAVNVDDLFDYISYLFGGGAMPSNLRANGDLNNDGLHNIADLVVLGGMVEQNYDASPPGRKDTSRDMIGLGPLPPCPFGCVPGDANVDGNFNLADVIYALNALYVPGSPPFPCSWNLNNDIGTNIGDVIYGLAYLFSGGPDLAECFSMITFETTFGGTGDDGGWSGQQTTDGGYILTGITESFGSNVYLVKTDSLGVEEWSQTFGGTDVDWGGSVQQTSDGGFIVTGWTWSFGAGSSNVWLIKTDANGNTCDYSMDGNCDGAGTFARTFGGASWDQGFSGQQTTDGGYILTGITESFGAGNVDVWLIKTSSDGRLYCDYSIDGNCENTIEGTFARTFGGASQDEGGSVQQTSDGGYIIAGFIQLSPGIRDVYLVKTDSLGVEEWSQTFGGTNDDRGGSVQQTSDGGYILTGSTESFGAGGFDVYLVKTDENGNEEWSQTYGGVGWDEGFSVQQTTDGGYAITGYTGSFGAGGADVYLVKTDENGNEEWSQTYGGVSNNQGFSVQQTSDEGFIITGYTRSFGAGGWDVYLIKTDQNGNVL